MSAHQPDRGRDDRARAAGGDRFVSVVALGALIGHRPIVSRESVCQALVDIVGEHRSPLIEANLAALSRGYDATVETSVPAA